MIIGAVAVIALLFGGSDIFTFDSVRDSAKEVIKDKDRAKQVVSLTKQADKEYKSFKENVHKLSEQFVKMNKDYNMTRKEMDSFALQAKKNRKAFFDKYVDVRFQITSLVTAEEWQAMHAKKG